ncbi:hypothetical protein PLICBS_000003 [Purpureocillium lilacinum]|uniref:uncharacterized protein n=1 Tax=Purpureocillium lilacinum TaxID=33203 RepID=UPI00208CF29A|nr:hypothetical protein PLICBS_000003 [Purpureocillium lilacinum]
MTVSKRNSAEMANIDEVELEAAGYVQAMPRQFSMWSLGALSFTLTCTWLGTGASLGIGIGEAGPAGALWSLVVAGVMTLVVSAGMAELASAYPVAGAQYYWSFMVASDKYKAFASYLNAWMSIIGWWLASGSVANFIASMLVEIASIWHPDFEPHQWQIYLIYVALIWLAAALNILGSRILPLYNQFVFMLSILTLGSTMIALFVVSRNKHASGQFIFADTTGQSGWTSEGFTFLLATSNAVFGFMGSDCGAHLCEEIANPAKYVPMVIMYPLVIGLLTAFPFAASLIYSITDLEAILNTVTGLPLIEIYFQATGSRVAASVLLSAFTFCFFGCLVGVGTTCSRTIWAVSRDGVLPFSNLWMSIHSAFTMPANATLLTAICVTLYGLIFLGSTTAFSAMVNTTILFLQTSCVIPQAILLYRGRDRVLPRRYFNLGKLGPFVNGISNMSYVTVVVTGLLSFVVILWVATKRGTFTGPHINVELMNERRQAALDSNLGGGDPEISEVGSIRTHGNMKDAT